MREMISRARARWRGLSQRAALAFSCPLTVLVCLVLGGCAGGTTTAASTANERAALGAYMREVEPVRLSVNRLLEGADPILSAYAQRRISPRVASQRMGELERRFAAYTVDVAAIRAATPELRSLHAIYAHTFIFEDSYLSALTTGLAERDLDHLPDTQSEQRAAIIQWRTGLEVLAQRLAFTLPADLQAAGRGEIAPSPDGS
jgi:hypothetical protein